MTTPDPIPNDAPFSRSTSRRRVDGRTRLTRVGRFATILDGGASIVDEDNNRLHVVARLSVGDVIDWGALADLSPRLWVRAEPNGCEIDDTDHIVSGDVSRAERRLAVAFALRGANVDMPSLWGLADATRSPEGTPEGEVDRTLTEGEFVVVVRGNVELHAPFAGADSATVAHLDAGECALCTPELPYPITVRGRAEHVTFVALADAERFVPRAALLGAASSVGARILRALRAKKPAGDAVFEDAAAQRHRPDSTEVIRGAAMTRTAERKEVSATAPRRRRLRHVEQIDETDCGPTCLLMIAAYFGVEISRSEMRSLVSVDSAGTTLLGLARGAQTLGLSARALKISRRNLEQTPLPAILHWRASHWVVLGRVAKERVEIFDPGSTRRWITREELLEAWNGYAVLVSEDDGSPTLTRRSAPSVSLAPFLRPLVPALTLAAALAIAETTLLGALPLFSQFAIDEILPRSNLGMLSSLLLGVGATFVLVASASVLRSYVLAVVSARLDASSLDWLAARLFALPLSYFQRRRVGDIERRLGSLQAARDIIVTNGIATLLAVLELVVVIVLLSLQNVQLALLGVLVIPTVALLSAFARSRLRPLYLRLEDAWGAYSSDQLDALRAIATVKSMNGEFVVRRKMLGRFLTVADHQVRASFWASIFDTLVRSTAFASTAAFLWIGVRACADGTMTIGAYVAAGSLLAFLTDPVHVLLNAVANYQHLAALSDRLTDVIEHPPEQSHATTPLRIPRSLAGAIELRGVHFAYDGGGGPSILAGIDLSIRAGERVAIVGRSGSGKTTLAHLLAALVEPTRGVIAFDGVDASTLLHSELRRRIGFVAQTTHLFAGTILENICFGEEQDVPRAIKCAMAAHAHEFIMKFVTGYETRVGESGILLSGGQAQRLALARALYRDPAILLLDEATSALDAESERAIQDNLDAISASRTTIVIAHRLSTVRDADRIFVMDGGRVVEEGAHEELISRRGLYHALVANQIGG